MHFDIGFPLYEEKLCIHVNQFEANIVEELGSWDIGIMGGGGGGCQKLGPASVIKISH